MKTLGIIGGMSPESTVTYYRLINQLINQAKSGNHSAPLVMVNVEFEQIVCLQKQGEWHKAGEILATAAKKLTQIGAEGILLATNTMHKVAPQIIDVIDVPFLHIIDATAKAIKIKNLTQVALLGTQFTMQDPFYRNLYCIMVLRLLCQTRNSNKKFIVLFLQNFVSDKSNLNRNNFILMSLMT